MTALTIAAAPRAVPEDHAEDRVPDPAADPTAGAGATLADLYRLHHLYLTRLAVLLVGDTGDAEDAVHDAFLRLWRRHGDRIDGLDNPLSYLSVAVLNNARTRLRRRKTARDHIPWFLPYGESAEDIVLSRQHRQVLDAVKALPRRQREVLVLRYWADMSEADIAGVLGISRGTVKSTASRGMHKLEQSLAGHAPR
ncbi:SigE family RNA polymerase sigma factor [Catenulispora subtropica]|uniref:SigE family RNA polymerase sigma factor n=1 Tax=Catenulispora subtropica TaxID=450798 RepID=A0ABN2R6L6_9ACTN